MAKVFWGAVCALLIAAAPVWAADSSGSDTVQSADENTVVMDTVNVTAKRYEAKDLDTGSFTTVISADEIEKKGGGSAYEVLQRTGGIVFSSSLPGGISQGGMNGEIGIRGIKGGEQVMVNGISIVEPTAMAYDLDQIPAAFLERMEVVKGANSTLYGSRAMTGVINMRTKRPGAPSVGGDLTGGSNGYAEGSAWFRNELVFVGASYKRFDDLIDAKKNYSSSRPYNTDLLSPEKYAAMVSVQPYKPLVFNYMFNYTDTAYRNDYYKTSTTSSYQVDETLYHHYLSAIFEKDRLKATAFFNYNYMDTEYDYYNAPENPGKTNHKTSYTTGLDAQHSLTWQNTDFLYGGTWVYESQDEYRQDVSGSASSGYTVDQVDLVHTRHQPSLFLQAERSFWDRLILTAGVRAQFVINTEEGSENQFEPVPQVQAVYKLNGQNSLYGNVGRAFRTPTFNQLYSETATLVGNADLNPEFGWTYELGWKFNYGMVSGSVSGFLMHFTDKIRYLKNEDEGRYYATNVDEYQTMGVEWNLAVRVHKYVTLNLGGYAADPYEVEDGEEVQAGPKYQLAPGAYYDDGRLQLGLNASIMLKREQGLDDYVNLHFSGSYKVNDWLKLKLKADNLLDQELAVYGNMTPGYSSRYEVLDPGLWVYAGFEINLGLK